MKEFKLRRIVEIRGGTLGLLEMPGNDLPNFVLEPLWKNNEHFVSCIPVGGYECQKVNHRVYGNTYLVEIISRPGIYFHRGNSPVDTEGCIIQGLDAQLIAIDPIWLGVSGIAFNIFETATGGDDRIVLTITNENKSTGQQDE